MTTHHHALHVENGTFQSHPQTMWTHWRRPSRIGEPSTDHTNPAPNVDAHCGGPPPALTCAPSACPCPGSLMRPESGSTSCSPEHGDMKRRPPHGANLLQGMASGKAVRVAPFETPARPAHPNAGHVRVRGQPGVQRFLHRTLYTVFLCASTRLWLLSRLLIELREERTTSDRLFLRVAEISQNCSSNAEEAAVLLDTPRIRMAMDPDALPSTG